MPHHLELVVDFVNTRDVESDVDELSSPAALGKWLADRDLMERRSTARPGDLRAAVELRESLREVLLAHNDASAVPADAVAVLDRVASRGGLSVGFGPGATPVTLSARRDGVQAALARLLAPVALAALDGTWDRVKACAADDCQWAFFDRSRNRSGRWCEMAACGNRTKVRGYRQRSRGQM